MVKQLKGFLKLIILCFLFLIHCTVTSFPSKSVKKGQDVRLDFSSYSSSQGLINFQKLVFADWAVDREGLIHLQEPAAVKAGLKPGDEPIQIYMYVLEHPVHGRYFIDTGIADVFRKDRPEWPIKGFVASAMKMEKLKVNITTGEWNKENQGELKGIFLTHMHIDHIMGTSDIPKNIPIYTGPKEASHKAFLNMFVRGTTDDLLGEKREIQELIFPEKISDIGLSGIDFFGDQSLIVFHSPGHTPGSLAFLIQSTSGPQLVVGDTCHTKFGWENNVPPGEFTSDLDENRKSLSSLKKLAEKIPNLTIHPGHQSL